MQHQLKQIMDVALGSKMMAAMDVETDLDAASGTRGTVCSIVLNEDEPPNGNNRRVRFQYQPEDILVKLDNMRMLPLQGLAGIATGCGFGLPDDEDLHDSTTAQEETDSPPHTIPHHARLHVHRCPVTGADYRE